MSLGGYGHRGLIVPGTSFLGRLHDDRDTPMARSYQSKWDRVATGDCQIAAFGFNYVDAM